MDDPAANSSASAADQSGSNGVNGILRGYSVVNLVSDVDEYAPLHIDTNLVNAWGMAFGPTGGIWISAADKDLSTIYNKMGETLRAPVSVDGGPTGQVFNSTTGFMIPGTSQVSRFIFATEGGTIAAWAGGDAATVAVDRSSAGAIYKGLTMAQSNGAWYLYATDFHNAHVDVFDANFNMVSGMSFSDPNIPSGFAPFNARAFNDRIVVTYAKQDADAEDDVSGPGNGYVDVYGTDGTFIKRVASAGALNSPWGLEMLAAHGKPGSSPQLLVGNFGDGKINVLDMASGNMLGQLMMGNAPLVIEGLWSISYAPSSDAYADVSNRIFFTAGPDDEEHGIFGYISKE
jgi:uncharacterized protein (TIGR03118 family)